MIRAPLNRDRRSLTSGVGIAGAALLAAVPVAGVIVTAWAQPAPKPPAHRPGVMEHVRALDGAVIHGDLARVRAAATWLADQAAPWTPPAGTAPLVGRVKDDAMAVAGSADAASAARATATLFSSCGACHQAAGVAPTLPAATPPSRDGIVGRMTRHQMAADLMLEGLVAPSAAAWARGAGELRDAPLKPGDYPVSDRIGALMAEVERRLHAEAAESATAADTPNRTRAYATLLTVCAECHTRHTTLWDPRPR